MEGSDVPDQRDRGPVVGGHWEPLRRRRRPAAGCGGTLRGHVWTFRHGGGVPQDAGAVGGRRGPAPDSGPAHHMVQGHRRSR
eukprot:433251-Alexandrium_andersonii.AAC.1